MSKSVRTEVIDTAHGTVEYQIVECASCGEEVRKEDATEFTLGNREGWACPYCADNGPIEFPNRWHPGTQEIWLRRIVFWPFVLTLPKDSEQRRAVQNAFIEGVAGVLLYATIWYLMYLWASGGVAL